MLLNKPQLFIGLMVIICVFSACNVKTGGITAKPEIPTPSILDKKIASLTGTSSEEPFLEDGAPLGVCVITEKNSIECYDNEGII